MSGPGRTPLAAPDRPPATRASVLRRALLAAPVTVPCLAAVAVLLWWAQADGGQPITVWAPGALVVLGLLALAVALVPARRRDVPGLVRAAVGLLAACTAWTWLTLLWADDQGAALEGADRALLYLAVFSLFALWPQRPRTAAWLLGAWTLGMGVLAIVMVLRIPGVADPARLFVDDRLDEPAGYPNAAAATWLMAFWPAVVLAAAARVPWALRGAFAGCAVVFADLALLSLSRGSLFAVPITAVLFFALVPGRVRHFAVLLAIGLAAGAAAPTVLDVGPAIVGHDAGARQDAVGAFARAVIVAALAAAAVVAVAGAIEALRPPGPRAARALRVGWTAAAVAAAVAVVVAGLVAAGDPVQRVRDGWDSFKGGYAEDTSGSRLVSGLGSNRYDFYRVALDVFADHPVAGAGVDNFFQDYLRHGRSAETPRYPHSLELRALSQTGLVGSLLLLAAIGAAVAAGLRAMRGPDALARSVAAGSVAVFAYWAVHGSADWFWEWAGLGAPAFAFLGLACGLLPRRAEPQPGDRLVRRPLAFAAAAVGGLAAALAIAGPWMAEREIAEAGAVFDRRPFEAYERLDRAATLDPLSDRPALVEGSIALRYGDLARADRAFARALARNPRGQYATLERGAIASARGDRARALALVERAARLAPRDPLAREALRIVRAGDAIDVAELNRRILVGAQTLAG